MPLTNCDLDVIKFVVEEGHGVKGLFDIGIEAVPKPYIQPEEERFGGIKVISDESIPVIDVSNWDEVEDSICKAASKWGFFQIINHGIPLEVLEDLKKSVHALFELPLEERRRFLKDNPSESVRMGTSFSPNVEDVLEWRDYVSMLFTSEDEASHSWPPSCKDLALEYVKRAREVVRKLLEVLLRKLDVQEIDKGTENMIMGALAMYFNYYAPCPNPDLTVGVGRHSDLSTITLLLQDGNGGLYVRGEDGEGWIYVPPTEGALIINVGDTLQILSNGLYKSIEHRAFTSRNKSRVSIPLFVNPAPDAVIGPLKQLVEKGEKPGFKQIVFADYVKYFFSKGHDGKKTMDFAKI